MTEKYWQQYQREISLDPMHSSDPFWKRVTSDLKRKQAPKHILELYSYCRTDNPFIRQIKSSPNITIDTVAEIICRDKSCELMYCQMLQQKMVENRRSKIDIKGCYQQYNVMTQCISEEKLRIQQKEQELIDRIKGVQSIKGEDQITVNDIRDIIQSPKVEMDI